MKTARRVFFITAAALFWLAAAGIIVFYFKTILTPNVELAARGHVILLSSAGISACFGVVLISAVWGRRRAGFLMRCVIGFFFLLYLLFLLWLTEFDKLFGRGAGVIFFAKPYAVQLYLQHRLNLVPFRTIAVYLSALIHHSYLAGYANVNLFGNICAFMPFAFFLPLLFKRMNRWRNFIVCVALIALAVEIAQLIFMTGSCDIDDLLLNVGGACLLYGLLKTGRMQKLVKALTLQSAG